MATGIEPACPSAVTKVRDSEICMSRNVDQASHTKGFDKLKQNVVLILFRPLTILKLKLNTNF